MFPLVTAFFKVKEKGVNLGSLRKRIQDEHFFLLLCADWMRSRVIIDGRENCVNDETGRT